MPLLKKERQVFKGRIVGCVRCGRRRGVVRRYRIHLCRQCFRDNAREIGFKKYS